MTGTLTIKRFGVLLIGIIAVSCPARAEGESELSEFTKAFLHSVWVMENVRDSMQPYYGSSGSDFPEKLSADTAPHVLQTARENILDAGEGMTTYLKSSNRAISGAASSMQKTLQQQAVLFAELNRLIQESARRSPGSMDANLTKQRKRWAWINSRFDQMSLHSAGIIEKALCPPAKHGQERRLTITQSEREELIGYIDTYFPEAKLSDKTKNPKVTSQFRTAFAPASLIRSLLVGPLASK